MSINRHIASQSLEILKAFPVLGLVGSRQVGKTTLAKMLSSGQGNIIHLDLESPKDLDKLRDPETYLEQFRSKLIIIDELQRMPELFPVLRSEIDKDRRSGRFILIGSASPQLIRDSSESLAGRIAYLELGPFNISEVTELDQLWLIGGYPEAFLNPTSKSLWLENYVSTYVERDLPLLGLNASSLLLRRLWTMLAHLQGQTVNYSEIAKSLDVNGQKVKSYIDFLEQAYLINQLRPYSFNTKKRLVKAPKVYLRDTGILHHLLGIPNMDTLFGHPKMGSSWEGFVIEQIRQHKLPSQELYFYRTQDGAELDLIIEQHGQLVAGVEIKFGDNVNVTRGNTEAANELGLEKRFVITKQSEEWTTKNGFLVTDVRKFVEEYLLTL